MLQNNQITSGSLDRVHQLQNNMARLFKGNITLDA